MNYRSQTLEMYAAVCYYRDVEHLTFDEACLKYRTLLAAYLNNQSQTTNPLETIHDNPVHSMPYLP